MGLPEADADDAAQQAFIAALARADEIAPGRERAFLYGIAVNLAARHRRSASRGMEELSCESEGLRGGNAPVDELIDQHRARKLLDDILGGLPGELREVLVLFEIEELSVAEIATILAIPSGTVASRLRRAREAFSAEVRRIEARARFSSVRAIKERP
jgi:RNA polymerase sigma-70 factor (ECF subfamily)